MKFSIVLFTAVASLASVVVARPHHSHEASTPAVSNANIIAQAYIPKVKGKGGQLDTNIRTGVFAGLNLTKTQKTTLWTNIKNDVGTVIWKANGAEIKALPSLIAPHITGKLKGNSAALTKVLAASTTSITADFKARAPAVLKGLNAVIPTKIATLLKKNNVAPIVTKNINTIVNVWQTKQLSSFAAHYTAANFPPALAKQLS